jgi:predicted Zn finger-like uncharacterized protein
MLTQCPHCQAIFKVTPDQLRVANGMVRCSQCREVFNGMEYVSFLSPEDLSNQTRTGLTPAIDLPREGPEPRPEEPPLSPLSKPAPIAPPRFETYRPDTSAPAEQPPPQVPKPTLAPEAPLEVDETEVDEQAIPSLLQEDLRAERHHTAPRRGGASAPLVAGSLVLALALLAQYLYFHGRELARHPALYPILSRTCGLLGCNIDPPRDLAAIEVLTRNVYTHPNRPDALMITATLANRASHAQPYPLMQVSLTDLQGKVVAMGRFEPEAYLPQGTDPSALMAPGLPLNVGVEVADPGNTALAFEFEFF